MADKRITDLPLIFSGDVTSTDVLPIVDVNLDITNKIEVDQLKSYILTGINDFYITGGTYDNNTGTLTLEDNNGTSFGVTGFTTGGTGTSLYEVGSGLDSTQRVGVNSAALGNISIIAGGSGNTASGYVSVISGGILNTSLGDSSVIGGGSCNTSGINGIVDSIYNQTFSGNIPFGGFYGSFSPSSTLSGLGSGSTFSFYFSSTNI
jgi:hypothetical protein